MARFAYLRHNGDSLIAAAAGFCFILFLAHHGGIGVSPDSVNYISVAENLRYHHALTDFSGLPMTDFPAFYPIFLQFVMLITGIKPLLFGPYLNGFLFALAIYLTGVIVQQFSRHSRWVKVLVLSCVVLSPSLQEVYSMLWSETLFIVLVLLLVLAVYRYYRVYSIASLLVMALITGLLCVTRYAGIAFFVTCACLLLVSPGLPWQKRLLHCVIFLPLSAILPFINLLHNNRASGTLTGYREKAINTLMDNVRDTGAAFSEWFPFLKNVPAVAALVALLPIAVFGLLWLRRLFRNKGFTSIENIATGVFLSYTLFMILSATISRYETLNSRLLCPVFIPLLLGMASCWMAMLQRAGARLKKTVIAGGLIFYGCFQYNQLAIDIENWPIIYYSGIPGYTEDTWKLSETLQYVQKNKSFFIYGYGIYSNANDAVWFFTGMKAELLPHKDFPADIQEFTKEKYLYVIWLDDGNNPDLVGLDFIVNTKKMVLFKRFEDGAIYMPAK